MSSQAERLIADIEKLQGEFQRIADKHPLIALSIRPDAGRPYAGILIRASDIQWETEADNGPRILDHHGKPLPRSGQMAGWSKWFDQVCDAMGMPPWVVSPADGRFFKHDPLLIPVVQDVDALTWSANKLLSAVLAGKNNIHESEAAEMRRWEREKIGSGFVRWIIYATPFLNTQWIEGYPQVAATALRELAASVTLDAAPEGGKGTPKPPVIPQRYKKLVELVSVYKSENLKKRFLLNDFISWAKLRNYNVDAKFRDWWNKTYMPGLRRYARQSRK